MKKLILSLLLLSAIKLQYAQTVTWSNTIAQILYNNCAVCHHNGGLAPFPLISYNDAYNQKQNISYDVSIKKMPPWPPDASYTRLAHERLLSKTDIQKITNWVADGAPMGDTTQAPVAPIFASGSILDTVSLSLVIPAFTVPGNQTTDLYQCFVLPSGLLSNMHITEMEVLPGNATIVHHVLVYQDTTGVCAQLDANSPGPGYTNFGGVGSNKAILLGGWVPGTLPSPMPTGTGVKIYKNADVILQIHYPGGSQGKTDSTRINFKLTSNTVRDVFIQPILNHSTDIVNGPLHIPANTVTTFQEHYQLPAVNVSGISVAPHCHLLGKQWISFGVTPAGDTVPFIKINDWSFHWQGFYQFRNVMKFPALSNLYAFCTYDNTANNPDNPNSPPQDVNLGESTTNEMMLVYFSYMLYQPGDENIVIDNSPLVDITDSLATTGINDPNNIVSTPQLYDAEPNPAKDVTTFSYFLPTNAHVELKIFDLNGRMVDEIRASDLYGYNSVQYNTSGLSSGNYLYSLSVNGKVKTKQLIVTK